MKYFYCGFHLSYLFDRTQRGPQNISFHTLQIGYHLELILSYEYQIFRCNKFPLKKIFNFGFSILMYYPQVSSYTLLSPFPVPLSVSVSEFME